MEQVAVGIGKRGCCSQVACRIGALGLKRQGVGLIGAYLYVAVQLIGVGHFYETYARILHSLQTGKVVVRTLQVGSAVGLPFLHGCGVEQHLVAQMDGQTVIAQEVDLTNPVSRMVGGRLIAACLVLQEMEFQVDILLAGDGVGIILNEVFVETEISTVCQESCYTLALGIERLYTETHSWLQQALTLIALAQHLAHLFVVDHIGHLTYPEWLSRMQQILGIELLALRSGEKRDSCLQESLVLHRHTEVLTRQACLQRIEDDGLAAEGISEKREDLGGFLLTDIGFERRSIVGFIVALHLHLVKDIFAFGNMLTHRARTQHEGDKQYGYSM